MTGRLMRVFFQRGVDSSFFVFYPYSIFVVVFLLFLGRLETGFFLMGMLDVGWHIYIHQGNLLSFISFFTSFPCLISWYLYSKRTAFFFTKSNDYYLRINQSINLSIYPSIRAIAIIITITICPLAAPRRAINYIM